MSGVTWTHLVEDGQSCRDGETLEERKISSSRTGQSTRMDLEIPPRYILIILKDEYQKSILYVNLPVTQPSFDSLAPDFLCRVQLG